MKKLLLTGVLTLAAMGLAQAQPLVWPQKWSTAKVGEAKPGGTYRISTISDFRTMNPFTTTEAVSIPGVLSASNYRGAGLVRRDPATGEWIPYMAESWTVSPNKLEITFKLRRGMKWSDGQAITADDFLSTWKIDTDEKVGSNRYNSYFIDDKVINLRKIDDYTLRYIFPKVDADAFAVASTDPWPDHVFGAVYRKDGAEGIKKMWGLGTKPEDLVSGGPWVMESYRPGERAIFKRNPTFGEWNKDEAGNALPYFERLEVRIVKDVNAQLAALLSGDIDFLALSTVDHISQVRRAIQDNKLDATLKVNASPVASSLYMTFNWFRKSDPFKQRLFQSEKFRRAMSHLMNRQAVVDVVYGGFGTVTYTSVYPILTQWVNNNVTKYPYDPKRAAQLLAELGFSRKDSEGWLVDGQGKRLEFTLATNAGSTQREDTAKLFADEAKKAGVKVNFVTVDFATLIGQTNAKGDDRAWDAVVLGFTGGSLDWPFGSNLEPCDGTLKKYNTSGKCTVPLETQIAALYSRGRTELDTKKRIEIGYQLQEAQSRLQAFIWIAGPNYHPAWSNRLGGEHPDKLINNLYGHREIELGFVKK